MCHHLTFEEDDNSSIDSNPLHDCHLTSAEEEEEEGRKEEHFPTAPLNDDVGMEEPVPDRHLCIHEHSQHNMCLYPCPYNLDPLHLTLDYASQYMDLSDIFGSPDVITASDIDIPNLEDVLEL